MQAPSSSGCTTGCRGYCCIHEDEEEEEGKEEKRREKKGVFILIKFADMTSSSILLCASVCVLHRDGRDVGGEGEGGVVVVCGWTENWIGR